MSKLDETAAPVRDVRVDRIGYCQDLLKLWSDPMRKALKDRLKADEIAAVEGDYYEGKLAAPPNVRKIDPAKFYKLLKAKKIKEKDFLRAIAVSGSAAEEFMAPRDLEAISTFEPGEPRFTISRKKGIDVPLATAVANVANAMTAGSTGEAAGAAAALDAVARIAA